MPKAKLGLADAEMTFETSTHPHIVRLKLPVVGIPNENGEIVKLLPHTPSITFIVRQVVKQEQWDDIKTVALQVKVSSFVPYTPEALAEAICTEGYNVQVEDPKERIMN